MKMVYETRTAIVALTLVFGLAMLPAHADPSWNWSAFVEGNAYSMSGGDRTKTDVDTGERETESSDHVFGSVENDVQLSHAHLKVNANLTDRLSTEVGLCLSHHEGLSVKEALLNFNIWEAEDFGNNISARVGRFDVPFGQFNARSEVGGFETISRPLLYPSHDIDYLQPSGNHPIPIFMSQYTDIGAQINGTFYVVDENQLWLGAYVVNGLYDTEAAHSGSVHEHGPAGEDDDHGEEGAEPNQLSWLQEERFSSDNNNDKALGARAAFTLDEFVMVGTSYMGGDYDSNEELSYSVYGGDVAAFIGPVTLRGEYVVREHDFVGALAHGDGASLMDEVETTGFYLQGIIAVNAQLDLVLGYDVLERDGIVESGDHPGEFRSSSHSSPQEVGTQRLLAAVQYQVNPYVALKLEYTHWMFDDVLEGGLTGAPDKIEYDDVDRISVGLAMTY